MSSYVAEILSPGERLIYQGHVSLFAILPSLIGGAIVLIVGIALVIGGGAGALAQDGRMVPAGIGLFIVAIGLVLIAAALIRRNSTELAVTDRRVIAKFGFISRSTVELNLTKIESIRVEQTVMGRLFGYGSVFVTGTGSTMDPIPFISEPIKFRQAVQSATDAMQRGETRV